LFRVCQSTSNPTLSLSIFVDAVVSEPIDLIWDSRDTDVVQDNDRVVHEIESIPGIVPAKNSILISEILVVFVMVWVWW